jgi:hypothetical protein
MIFLLCLFFGDRRLLSQEARIPAGVLIIAADILIAWMIVTLLSA